MQLQNSDILKGSAVMVFINGEAVAFATSELNFSSADLSSGFTSG